MGSVYVGCTEGVENNNEGGGGGKQRNNKGATSGVADLVKRVVHVVESRTDISNDGDAVDVCVLPTLSKAKATSLAESTLNRLLGDETSESHLAYRGDKRIAEEPLILWCMGLFFSADRSYCDDGDDAIGTYRVCPGTLTSHMALDRTAAEAIHLLPPRNGSGAALITGGNASNNSLFGVLNHCKTKMGSRTLEVWLRQPLVNLEEILRRQSAVAKLVDDSIGRDRLREEGLATLRGIDIDGLGYKLSACGKAAVGDGAMGSTSKALENLYKLHLLADKCLPPILEVMNGLVGGNDGNENEDCALRASLEALEKTAEELSKAVSLAEAVIDFDSAPRDFIVNPNLDSNLGDVKAELDGIQQELEEIHAEMNAAWYEVSKEGGMQQVRLEDVDSNSNTSCVWQFRLPKTNDAKMLTDSFDSVKIHRILKNGGTSRFESALFWESVQILMCV